MVLLPKCIQRVLSMAVSRITDSLSTLRRCQQDAGPRATRSSHARAALSSHADVSANYVGIRHSRNSGRAVELWLDDKSGFGETFNMGKAFPEMTLEQLWEMFPIYLVAHDDRWKDSFKEMDKTLTGLLSNQPVDRTAISEAPPLRGYGPRISLMC